MKTNNQWNNEHSNQLKENMLSAYNAMSEAEQKNIADLNNVELKDEFDRLELPGREYEREC